jgi:hypothetical protein
MKRREPPSVVTAFELRPDGAQVLVVPYAISPWRLGQRVWFQAVSGRIEITPTPQGRRGERRYSARVRRGQEARLRR